MDVAVKSRPVSKRENVQEYGKSSEYGDHECVQEFCAMDRDSKELPELVKKYNGSEIKLKEPKGYAVRITDLDGTIYWGRDEMLESWSELYLLEPTEMVVIGAIDNFPSLAEGLQLIVLVDSQGKVYFYENEVLHLIACSLTDFFKGGARSPPLTSYKYGQYLQQSVKRRDKITEDLQNKDKAVKKK